MKGSMKTFSAKLLGPHRQGTAPGSPEMQGLRSPPQPACLSTSPLPPCVACLCVVSPPLHKGRITPPFPGAMVGSRGKLSNTLPGTWQQ